MNLNIDKLYNLSKKRHRLILGLMSGTSLDGLDMALCRIQGNGVKTVLDVLHTETVQYTPTFRAEIQSIFAKEEVSTKMLCVMNAKIARIHAELVNVALQKWGIHPTEIDAIASHGQTIYHAPNAVMNGIRYPNSTLQIGDGDHIAVLTRIITLSDFRQKHLAAGGQGAPLVVYGDYLLFSHPNENRVMLNIGGISNITFLPSEQQDTPLLSSDVGPGNTLLNQYMKHYFNLPYDQDGQFASKGKVNTALFKALIAHPFFDQSFPKTTGPEEFHLDLVVQAKRESLTQGISHQDSMATLVSLTAYGIAKSIKKLPEAAIYLSGGGLYNACLLQKLHDMLPDHSINSTAALNMPPDAKEAALFALLANETLAGKPIDFPKSAGAPAVCMGKISFPN